VAAVLATLWCHRPARRGRRRQGPVDRTL